MRDGQADGHPTDQQTVDRPCSPQPNDQAAQNGAASQAHRQTPCRQSMATPEIKPKRPTGKALDILSPLDVKFLLSANAPAILF